MPYSIIESHPVPEGFRCAKRNVWVEYASSSVQKIRRIGSMSQSSTPSSVTMTYRSKPPKSPDEVRLQEMYLRLWYFIMALFWSTFIVQQILLVYQLLIADIPVKIFYQFVHHRVSPAAIGLIAFLITDAVVVCFLSPEIRRILRECFLFHGFARLYYVCPYLDSSQSPVRFSQSLVLRIDKVTYNYSKSSFLITTGELVNALPSPAVVQHVVESTEVIVGPRTADGEITAPARAPQLEETTLTSVEVDQEPSSHGLLGTKTYLLISLEQGEIRISIAIEVNGKLVEVVEDVLKHPRQKALVVYLATQKSRVWVKRESILTDIYSEVSDRTQGLFHQDVHRIRNLIQSKSSEAGIDVIDPFEKGAFVKGDSRWRRSRVYKVPEKYLLFSWYREIKDLRVALEGTKGPDIDVLRRLCRLLIKSYSHDYIGKYPNEDTYTGGYLLNYLSLDAFKNWVSEVFKEYRRMYIYILQYTAERELSLWDRQEDKQCLRNAIRLYQECAFAAICGLIDCAEGEKALRKCIEMYMLAHDNEAAQQVCVAYGKCMRRVLSEWEPEDATKVLMQKHLLIAD